MSGKEVLIVGGGSCGLTCAWLLENQQGINVTLVDKRDRLGGHIDTKRYQCTTQLIDHQPTEAERGYVESLHGIIVIRRNDHYVMGFCDHRGCYSEVAILNPTLLIFLQGLSLGQFSIPAPYIKPFNDLLREVNSCQRVTVYVVERGAEFIGDKKSYPLFHTICEYLKVKLRPFLLTEQFNGNNGEIILLPPKLSGLRKSLQDLGIFGESAGMFDEISALFDTLFVICGAERQLKKDHPLMTLREFVDIFVGRGMTSAIKHHRKKFVDTFLYPLLAAAWGVSADAIKGFMAHYAMNYLALGERWIDVPEGLDTYIERMRLECQHAEIRINIEIKKIESVEKDFGVKYKALLQDGSYLQGHDGRIKLFDYVVLATPANVTCVTMPTPPGLSALQQILSKVRYYPTRIVVHRDPKYLSPYQYVVLTTSTKKDGVDIYANTTCKYRNYDGEIPVFRSWVLPGQPLPNNRIDVIHYEHPVIDSRYYQAQQALHAAQGTAGLYFGNIIGGFNDSNESTQSVAIRIAYDIFKQLSFKKLMTEASALDAARLTAPKARIRGEEGYNRFELFTEYLKTLDKLDAASDQLGADVSEEKPTACVLS